jgi:GGDEF domain-containing protein
MHREGPSRDALMSCEVCGKTEDFATCEPLLVSGEVIGAALVLHPQALADSERGALTTSVGQAAPVLANLRNLALAEFRAATDSLTGLPNSRATRETLKRMVAQASRTVSPLSALLLDLDHFKQINDSFGHGRGDDVLAAVGNVIPSVLREGDFVGRYGGEEFLILLPATGRATGPRSWRKTCAAPSRRSRSPAATARSRRASGSRRFPTMRERQPRSCGTLTAPCTRRRRTAATVSRLRSRPGHDPGDDLTGSSARSSSIVSASSAFLSGR